MSRNRALASLFGKTGILSQENGDTVLRSSAVDASTEILADMNALITKTGMAIGDQAYVQSNNKLYLYNGTGWYLVATVANSQPTSISAVESTYELANDGTATVITAVSEDPDGFPLTWSYAVTAGELGSTATVSQTDNVFTITPSTDSANAGEFSITFSVTDGSTGVVSAVSAFTLAFGWTVDLSNVTYDNVSFNVTSQQANPTALTFNADGTKMYVGGNTNLNEKIDQYSLSTAFDVSTASYDSVSFPSLDIQELYFSTDGTKLFWVNLTTVFQNSLSTPFDLSTASYDNVSLSVSSQETICRALAFNNNGTKMYVAGSGNDTIYQYSLSTAFDLSTASYDSIGFSVSSIGLPYGIRFNTDGTKMYIQGFTDDQIYQYSLSTGFDVLTASSDNTTFSVTQQALVPESLHFSADGTKVYVLDNNADNIHQYSTGL